jgi:hypothetical protein
MKLTKDVVIAFEEDQKQNGTEIALQNYTFLLADELLKNAGVRKTHVTWRKTLRKDRT